MPHWQATGTTKDGERVTLAFMGNLPDEAAVRTRCAERHGLTDVTVTSVAADVFAARLGGARRQGAPRTPGAASRISAATRAEARRRFDAEQAERAKRPPA